MVRSLPAVLFEKTAPPGRMPPDNAGGTGCQGKRTDELLQMHCADIDSGTAPGAKNRHASHIASAPGEKVHPLPAAAPAGIANVVPPESPCELTYSK